jgi:hypothetical protein
MPIISPLRRQRGRRIDWFKISLGYIANPYLKTRK